MNYSIEAISVSPPVLPLKASAERQVAAARQPGEFAAVDNLYQWLGWAFAALLGGTWLLKGQIKFDLNEWLKERRKHKEENIRLLCPHVQGFTKNDERGLRSTYISAPRHVVLAMPTVWPHHVRCGRSAREPGPLGRESAGLP